MKNYLKELTTANDKLNAVIRMTERELKSKIEFDDYSIFYQPTDGFVLEYKEMNAPLAWCLTIIKTKGSLTYEDYLNESI